MTTEMTNGKPILLLTLVAKLIRSSWHQISECYT